MERIDQSKNAEHCPENRILPEKQGNRLILLLKILLHVI